MVCFKKNPAPGVRAASMAREDNGKERSNTEAPAPGVRAASMARKDNGKQSSNTEAPAPGVPASQMASDDNGKKRSNTEVSFTWSTSCSDGKRGQRQSALKI